MVYWLSGLLFMGCFDTISDRTPEKILKEFLETVSRVQTSEDRSLLIPYLDGQALIRLQKMTPDEFKKQYVETKREHVKLQVLETLFPDPNRATLTYRLDFIKKNDLPARVQQKKMAEFIKKDTWKINSVTTLLESVEFLEGVQALP